ncbi:MAG: phage major capsid protein [Chitinophagaceae bacterium]
MIIKKKAPAGTKSRIEKSIARRNALMKSIKEMDALMKSHNISPDAFRAYQGRQFMAKADLATATFRSQGGCLDPYQEKRFIRNIVESPTILNYARVVDMPTDKYKIPKLAIGSQFFVGGVENTAIASGDRTAPIASEVILDASELVGQFNVPYETMEDNLEGDDFVNTLLDLVSAQAALDLENLMLKGDTSLDTSTQLNRLLRVQDGYLKIIQSYVVNAGSAAMGVNVIGSIIKALPEKYRNDLANLRLFVNPNDEINLRLAYATRATNLGDQNANSRDVITPLGVPATRAATLGSGVALLTDPRNLILGIRRRITLEMDRDIETRQFKFVMTCRVAVNIQEEKAVVRAYGIA